MTVKIGYAAMLEQFHPTEALGFCVAAEASGFEGVMASDHLQPWVPQQGQSAFVWSFMAAAAESACATISWPRASSISWSMRRSTGESSTIKIRYAMARVV